MLKLVLVFALVMLALPAAACSPGEELQQASIAPQSDSATAEVTAERTETPIPSHTPVRRPTLPPTWTPTHTPTDSPTPTPYTPAPLALATSAGGSNLAECLSFGPDGARNSGTVRVGESATVYWNPAGGRVYYYEIILRDASGEQLEMRRPVPEARSYTFDASHFTFNGVYTWQITPYDPSAEPICDSRTSELRATIR